MGIKRGLQTSLALCEPAVWAGFLSTEAAASSDNPMPLSILPDDERMAAQEQLVYDALSKLLWDKSNCAAFDSLLRAVLASSHLKSDEMRAELSAMLVLCDETKDPVSDPVKEARDK
eukprot:9290702-Lingulodinium_polyedra.AAC.1